MTTIAHCRSTSRCGRFQTMVCAAAVFLGKLIGWLALAVLPMLLFAATATATAAGQVQPEPTIEAASPPLVKLPETIKQPLALDRFTISYWVDSSGQASFAEAREQSYNNSPNRVSLGTSAKSTWVRFQVVNPASAERDVFLQFPHAYHNKSLGFYETDGKRLLRKAVIDLNAPEDNPYLYKGAGVFSFQLAPGEQKTLYVHSVSYSHQWFELQLLDAFHSKQALVSSYTDSALIVGILIALVIYNLLLYFFASKRENIFYSLYLVSAAIWIALSYGLLSGVFEVYGDTALQFHTSLMAFPIFLILFMTEIFKTKLHHPTEHKFLQAMLALLVVAFVWSLFDIQAALQPASSLAALMMVVTLSVGISLWLKGEVLARYFLIGHGFFVFFNALAVLYYKGMLGFHYVTSHGVGIGIMLEALMLAFIIAYRMKLLEDMKAVQEELKLQAATDPLTRLYNRRFFYAEADYLLQRAQSEHYPVSILTLDIDRFKQVNDTFGHAIGDRILQELADILKGSVRESDIVARFGGEEFVILLNKCDFRAASKLAEQIRVAVTKHAIELSASETMSFTISIGLTEVLLGKEQIDDAIHRADLALYSAKKAGRNRVEARV
ncbi:MULTISPECIES: sensor domain-containing diguanylate cyclase [unclassified Idiomarina]|uniref:sensor domain-containing diguanylate cyclase n=2 Tax=Idiomarinaceae TaxID=267893 RepID=UPI00129D1283|nr:MULTISPECIES: diguanylate cyclase [unclassified Idiomarina]MRJ42681.1 diguanylate cyclase [Idiomarina sp. FeN1]NCU57899.1 diguanylate cyclase [Idiomarina sp. FenA--70]NCU60451.1 diguanylate cyclase [Idiomarina sp. FenBw--71]